MLNKLMKNLPFIENKYHRVNEPFDPFRRMQYHGWDCDPATGLDDAEMKVKLEEYLSGITDTDHALIKAKAFAFVLDNMRFTIDEHDYFPCFYNWGRPINKLTVERWLKEVHLSDEAVKFKDEYYRSGDVHIWMDYDHSVPDWKALYELGFAGILERAESYRSSHKELDSKQQAYFESIKLEYSAILRLINRLHSYALNCSFEKAPMIAEAFEHLSSGAPRTLYDRLMLIYLYFMLSESVDSYQVRSLGNGLDNDLTEPYRADLASGKFTAEQLDEFIGYFLMQYSAIGNYWGQPMYLGGSNNDGSCKVNEVTYRILDIYDELGIYNPKIQVKYAENTPRKFLEKICDMIRRGHSSFVFVCEDNIRKGFINIRRIPYERCYDFDVKGCYEFTLRAGEFSTAPLYINLLGSVIRALKLADDSADYAEIERLYFKELEKVFEGGIMVCNELERHIGEVNPAPMLSATITHSLEAARDAYSDGAELNTTGAIVGGLGSAVDSLMAIKTLVFDEKRVTLSGLKEVLQSNWETDPLLRTRALNCTHKHGCGDPDSDALAAKICDLVASYQGRPNTRGGYYKVDMHSARQYIMFGKLSPATPDGRLSGEETSKNASPTQGMDRNGVTALIRSAISTRPDRFTEGYGFDVMLHETAVKGDDGLDAMISLLTAYANGGGSTIQFNVFNASTLRDAQENPQKYQSLQIRVCGWNVLWNNMPKSEQDKYIERAENLA